MNPSLILFKINALFFSLLFAFALGFAQQAQTPSPATSTKLAVSAKRTLKVAFVLTDGAVMIDFAGPWEVFQDVMIVPQGHTMHEHGIQSRHPFELYTVSDEKVPIRTSGGMQIIPDYTFDDAPQPDIVVIPAQNGNSPKMMDWIRKMAQHSGVVMSV